ncbi:MAG: hypothetical protein AMJ56_17240 [Anaerolineae bacterium SG8_19]|nr:MAG: hypothetical protein AMJ56_17240 [Anaerolineae bacterium SG8_19]
MQHIHKLCKISLILLIVGSLAIGLSCNQVKRRPKPIPPYVPIITEISPQTTEKEFPWIELNNPTEQKINASHIVLVINDDYRYALPDKLPPMPPQSYVLIKFDKNDERADIYEFRNGKAVLHAGPKLENAITRRSGQIAVYKKDEQGQEKLVDFVSWGAPGSQKSLTPERNKIWRKQWFVPQIKTFGDYDEEMLAQTENFTIARYPGSVGRDLSDWVVLYGKERTPGAENNIPGIGMFTLMDNAVVRSEDISVGWTTSKFGQKYKFQVARDSTFQNIVEDVMLTKPYYKPKSILPEGTYYYQVKVIDAQGRESVWSKTMRLNSKRMGDGQSGIDEDGAITKEVLLTDMQYRRQRKDTKLLCLDGCPSHLDGGTVKHWDNIHPDAVPVNGDHGDMNCVRASISMMVSFYGRTLSQDRIAYFTQEERAGIGNGIPEGDLAHSDGMSYSAEETAALEWALDETITDFFDTPNPGFNDLKGWLDANRPIMTRKPGHLRAMNGYREEDTGEEWVHILDPWSGERWETYATWNGAARGTWVGPPSAPNAREDEPEIATDADNDGVMDFDEQIRFGIGRLDVDSDNEGVNDKEDIYEYVYQFGDVYAKRDADFDADGVRKENDPDNDADTFNDGCEDKNGNGIYEPGSGETDNFAVDVNLVCDEKPIHAIMVFDRSGSMAIPSADPKYDRAADAAALFLDAWLANDPPAQTKVGLVYYDHNAYFDANDGTNTTLELLSVTKRDKIVASFAGNAPNYGSTSIGGGILKAMDAQGFNVNVLPVDDQHRVMVVLTDGKENTGTRMDDPAVTQALVDNKVDGYVLGIGDENQIDEYKLSALADILNHPPASLAMDLDAFQLEKFFLQVLAETQGMEFNLDPVEQITIGQTKMHEVPVNPGAERVTFVVVWNETNGKIDFTLKDPDGQAVTADVTKAHNRYQVSSKTLAKPGQWTLTLTASSTATPAPSVIHYSVMAMEKNTSVSGYFEVQGVHFLTGDNIRLTATLSRKNRALLGAKVVVKAKWPTIGLGTFTSIARLEIPSQLMTIEKDVKVSPVEKKYQVMAQKKLKIPTMSESIILNDEGKMGDEIPGDGIYTSIFKQTRNDGIYTFRFLSSAGHKEKVSILNREKVFTVHIKPKIRPQLSSLNVIKREYNAADEKTHVTLAITPKDSFGNLIGPGQADLLKLDVKQGQVAKIVDNLDGSYEVEMIVPGNYKGRPNLWPTFRPLDAGQKRTMK